MPPNPQTVTNCGPKSQMLETYRGHLIQTKTSHNDNDDDDNDDDDKLLGLSTWPVWVECEPPLSWLSAILLLHRSFQMLPYIMPSLLLMGYVLAW